MRESGGGLLAAQLRSPGLGEEEQVTDTGHWSGVSEDGHLVSGRNNSGCSFSLSGLQI